MTTYQEPLSRRAARQRERADAERLDAGQNPSATDAFSPAAPFPAAVPPQRPAAAQPEPAPRNDGPQFASPYPLPQPAAWPQQQPSAPTGQAPVQPAPRVIDGDAQQQFRGRRSATGPVVPLAPEAAAPLSDDATRTRSRRELRELREQTGIMSEPSFGLTQPETPMAAQPVVPGSSAFVVDAPPEQPATRRGRRAAEATTRYAQPVDYPASADFGVGPVIEAELVAEPSEPQPSAPQPVVLQAVSQPIPVQAVPQQPAPLQSAPLQSAPLQSAPLQPAPLQPAPVQSAPVPMAAEPLVEPDDGVPVGHWSTQADIDERVQTHPAPTSRTVGVSGAQAVTSTLVLPPSEDPLLGAMSRTGEIMLTGSIQLPASLSSTGALPEQLEHPSLDHTYDGEDRSGSAPDSAPVRALAAVSTQTSAHGIIQAQQASNRSFTILIIAAASMAVLVGALVVVGLVTGLF